MPKKGDFVAVGLLTQRDLDVLGTGFRRAIPLKDTTDFTALLARIDKVTEGSETSQKRTGTAAPSTQLPLPPQKATKT